MTMGGIDLITASHRTAEREIVERRLAEEFMARSEVEARRLAQENALLAEIGRIVNSSLDLNKVYESIAQQVHNLIPFDRISIVTADLEAGALVPEHVAGIEVTGWRIGDVVPLSESTSGTTIKTKKPQFIRSGPGGELRARSPGEQLAYKAGLRSGITVPIVYNDEVIGGFNLRSTSEDAYSQRDLLLAERIATQIAGAIANARLHGHLQHEADEREVLAEIGRIISSTLDIDQVYERFADQVRKLIPFDRIVISRIDVEGDGVATAYISGVEVPGVVVDRVFSLAGTAEGVMVRTRSSVVDGAESPEAFAARFPTLAPTIAAGLRSLLTVPLISNDELIATMTLRSTRPNAYAATEVATAERVSAQIAGAIANAQLHAELRCAEKALRQSEHRIRQLAAATVRGHEEERQWAAIEVHDSVSQPLVELVHNIQALESMASGDSEMGPPAHRASELAQQAIGASRNIMDYLYPDGLEEFGIVPLLETDLHRFHEDTGSEATLDTTLDADSEVMMPQVLTVTLYRIFQEALTNIRRHANGTKMVAVSLRCTDRFVSLEVKDDGAGFDDKTSKPEGRVGGLMIMSRRAEIIGGTLDISSTQGQGTTITARVPIDVSTFESGIARVRAESSPGVSLSHSGTEVRVVLDDDGPGFDPDEAHGPNRMNGLTSMRRRAELVGGTVN